MGPRLRHIPGILAALCLLAAAPATAQVRVLLYHAYPSFGYTAAQFAEHMDFLRSNGYTTITPFQLLNWMQYDTPLPIRPILVTMDDNYIPVVDEVFPILQARGMVAVNFAHTNYDGSRRQRPDRIAHKIAHKPHHPECCVGATGNRGVQSRH
jgi:hypothetical protein